MKEGVYEKKETKREMAVKKIWKPCHVLMGKQLQQMWIFPSSWV